ncbi:GTPase IMAP family member 7-like [Enoplosus armatus]|uniref:GTPase IMAP family member 7-like n=1 Tax=Enoplosus armatus TaxID=215367 RepID=UPI00399224EB
MDVLTTRRIVLLGKEGAGKSSLANIRFGETVFKINHSSTSITSECQAETKSVNGRRIALMDTPGFFDTGRSEEELKSEIVRCITECAPGPHAFLIVLRVEKFTEHEQAVVKKICQYFSEEAIKYAVVLFTHGDELPDGMKIEEFVNQSEGLSDLVQRCGSRCHVVDNRRWKNNQQDEYRSNQFQVAELLRTIDQIIEANAGGYYTNDILQAVNKDIEQEEECIRQSAANMPPEEITHRARTSVFGKQLFKAAGVGTGALLGAFLGRAMKLMNKEGSTVALVLVRAAEGATPPGAAQTAEEHLD